MVSLIFCTCIEIKNSTFVPKCTFKNIDRIKMSNAILKIAFSKVKLLPVV